MSDLRRPARPRVPPHLRPGTKRWYRNLVNEFEFEAWHERLLQLAAESWDRSALAREVLEKEGLVFTDRHGAIRARPEVGIARDAANTYMRAMRELALDIAPPDSSRPPKTGRPLKTQQSSTGGM